MNLYQRLLALTDEAITTLRTIQETQTESQRNAMASRAANDSIKAFYDSQRGTPPGNERKAVVSWLRESSDNEPRNPASSALGLAADCIERGEHMGKS